MRYYTNIYIYTTYTYIYINIYIYVIMYIYIYIYTYAYTRVYVFIMSFGPHPEDEKTGTNPPCQAVELLRKRQMHQLVVQAGTVFFWFRGMGTVQGGAKHLWLKNKASTVGKNMVFLWCFQTCSFNQPNQNISKLKCPLVFWHSYLSH